MSECESRFNECLHPPWWKFWETPDPNQCLAERQACLRECAQVSPEGCGEGICEPGENCLSCCQFFCPDHYSECTTLCSPYR